MLIRILSSIVALPLLFFFVLKGGLYLEGAVALISLVALYEFINAISKKYKPIKWPTFAFVIAAYTSLYFEKNAVLSGLIALYIGYMLINYLFDDEKTFGDVGISALGTGYIIFFFYHVILISRLEAYMIWLIFIVSWGADTGAYFIGVFFGKRKLLPKISPKKTIEGAIGGMATAAILATALTWYFDKSIVAYVILIAIVGSMVSIIGDLVASKIKRQMDIKDFGNIMPGHGGILDRFDSLLLVSPFVYYALKLVIYIQ